jgi:hypothetical protein
MERFAREYCSTLTIEAGQSIVGFENPTGVNNLETTILGRQN